MVAAHGVDGDSRPIEVADLGASAEGFDVHAAPIRLRRLTPCASAALLGLLLADLHGLTSAVPAAVGAGVVGALGLVAMRARFQARDRERVVRAPLALASARDTPLGDSHGLLLLLGSGG
jgi:hypothetical protein